MPGLWDLLKASLYIGATGYGGPAILSHMKNVIVKEKQWLPEKEFMEGLSMAQLLPGAVGVTLMGHIGYRLKKYPGAVIMSLSFALPAFIMITLLSWAYFRYGQLPFVKAIFTGLGALVVALLINAINNLGKSVFPMLSLKDYKGLMIAAASFIGIFAFHVNITWLIFLSGFLGILFYAFTGELKTNITTQSQTASTQPTSFSAKPHFIAILTLLAGTSLIIFSPLRTLFLELFKIGALAFGGGFTSIPLMQHVLVDQQHWVNLLQFRDGIAMGQITPGPVLITAAFIGYHVWGIVGAAVATLAIFLPSLIGILLLGSFHEKIKHNHLTKVIIKGLLTGFLGLIMATIINFGVQSLINWQTWSIFLASLIAIIYFKKDPVWTILATIVISLIIF